MNILFTGGSGVIGSRLIEKLLPEHKIIALGREYSKYKETIRVNKNFKFYQFDLSSEDEIFIDDSIDMIVHLAGVVSGEGSKDEYIKGNLVSTEKIINYAVNTYVDTILFASSISVYGSQSYPLVEFSSLLGSTEYAKSKILAEENLLNSGIQNVIIFRIASVFGENTKGFIHKLQKLVQFGILPSPLNEKQKKSFIHIDDLIEFFYLAISNPKKGIYNIAHPKSISYEDIIDSILFNGNYNFYYKMNLTSWIQKLVLYINIFLFKFKLSKSNTRIDLKPILELIEVNPKKAIETFSYTPKFSITNKWSKK
jgi:nucleoside-diphosphate-sugar epimerase